MNAIWEKDKVGGRIDDLLELVEKDGPLTITRDGKPVAELSAIPKEKKRTAKAFWELMRRCPEPELVEECANSRGKEPLHPAITFED